MSAEFFNSSPMMRSDHDETYKTFNEETSSNELKMSNDVSFCHELEKTI